MKKLITISIICLLYTATVYAEQDSTVTLKDLEIPNSPGFILLDKTPTSIERPNSSKAFMLSVVNSFSENKGFPQNYAVEFTPFWFLKHPDMTFLKYVGYNKIKDRQMIFNNIKKGSFSFAYITTTDSVTKNQVNNLSLSFRTNFISIKSKIDIEDLRNANKKLIEKLKDQNDRLVKYIGDLMLSVNNPTLYDQKVREFYAAEELRNKEEKNEISEILKRRAVFAIDGAVAINTFILDNNYSANHFGRFGAWLTLNYSQVLDKKDKDKSYLNLYALGRYLSDGTTLKNNEYISQNFYDFGGKLELEFKKLSVAYEYIYRINDISNTFRSNGIVKYKISDQLYLTGAFGKNFGDNNNLISLLGLNWGLSSGTEKPKIEKE